MYRVRMYHQDGPNRGNCCCSVYFDDLDKARLYRLKNMSNVRNSLNPCIQTNETGEWRWLEG